MGKTIGLISLKGGVGKTTLSCALAADLARNNGKKVLLIDANYSAPNLGIHMNIISPKKTVHDILSSKDKLTSAIHRQYGIDVIPGNFLFKRNYNPLKLRNKLAQIKKKYDFVVLDGSPSLNNEVLSTMLASDQLFVVSTPDYPTLSCSMKAARLAKQRNKPIAGIILNKVKKKYGVSLEEVQESTGIPVVAKIRDDSAVDLALSQRVPANLFVKNSAFSKEIRKLGSALAGKQEKRNFFSAIFSGDMKREQINRELMRKHFYEGMFK